MKTIKTILLAGCLLIFSLTPASMLTAQDAAALSASAESAATNDTDTNPAALGQTNAGAASQSATVEQHAEGRENYQPIVLFGQNAELKAGDTAETVVVIGGSAAVHGNVRQAVVVIGGNATVDGDVGQAVVAVFGNVHLNSGAVVHQDAVAVMGTVAAGPDVKVDGNTVSVGGKLDLASSTVVKGDKVSVGLPVPFANVDWLRNWITHCVFEFRPLAPQVGVVWLIAAVFFLIYLFVAAAFPRPVQTCVNDLHRRPATIFLMGLLTKLLIPFVYLILAITGVGLIVLPIIGVTLFLLTIVGKVAVLEWIGFKLGHLFGGRIEKPVAAFLAGIAIITLLYMVPVLGLVIYIILGIWGLGSGIMAVFGRARRETPENPVPPTPPPVSPIAPVGSAASNFAESNVAPPVIPSEMPPTGGAVPAEPSPAPGAVPPPSSQPAASVSAAAVPADVSSFPKANLWERFLAAILDLILIGIVTRMAHLGSFSLLIALAYFSGMWAWRGTTVGGIVLKLKVVRVDGGTMTFVVALVRGLAAAFSVVVLFLGFLWIAWDKDKQGWHDKIAGTLVIRLPQVTPLVML